MVATETGYYTGSSQYSISELAQAKYIPRVFAEYFRHSIAKTFIYEFLDEGADGEMEDSFGLVRADLTQKPAYFRATKPDCSSARWQRLVHSRRFHLRIYTCS